MSAGDSIVRPKFSTFVDAYGVRIGIAADDESIFEQVKAICAQAFVGRLAFDDNAAKEPDLRYLFRTLDNGEVEYDLDGERVSKFRKDFGFSRHFNSIIRAHVAGRSKEWVFVHAGVVEWRGKAIVIPGRSHQGKTTLVSELIRIGARYMSDEFAILDSKGLVHPFDRDLAVRTSPEIGMESLPPSEFGAEKRLEPIEAGMLLFTNFDESAVWSPERITVGSGILEAIPQVIPVSFNTKFALKVLNTTFNRAIIVRSDRGEARDTAPRILDYFDESLMTDSEGSV
jgi:hypothetical protein